MKVEVSDTVDLKDGTKATILKIDGDNYYAEVVNPYGITNERYITASEIS